VGGTAAAAAEWVIAHAPVNRHARIQTQAKVMDAKLAKQQWAYHAEVAEERSASWALLHKSQSQTSLKP